MTIALSPETQRLLEEQMVRYNFASADHVIQAALAALAERYVIDDELDEETEASIERGLMQAEQGLGRPWAEVEKELLAKLPPEFRDMK